jgi:hypothetical protein
VCADYARRVCRLGQAIATSEPNRHTNLAVNKKITRERFLLVAERTKTALRSFSFVS